MINWRVQLVPELGRKWVTEDQDESLHTSLVNGRNYWKVSGSR